MWLVFRGASTAPLSRRAPLLVYAALVIGLAVLAVWLMHLMLGPALVIHPYVGTAVATRTGSAKTNLMTALYTAGNSITLVGSRATHWLPRSGACVDDNGPQIEARLTSWDYE